MPALNDINKFLINIGVPMMDTEYVTDIVLEAILTNQKILLLPRLMYVNMFLKW
jgi:hypothetical protein